MIIIPSRRRQRCRTNTNRNSNRRFTVLPTTYIALLSFVIATRYSIEGYCPVVICPGFCNDSHDYETDYHQPSLDGTSSANSLSDINPLSDINDHSSLKSVLAKRGFIKSQIYTIPVQRHDWIRSIAGGLLFDTRNFQQCTTQPDGVAYGWYIKRLKEMVDVAYNESGGQKVLLIGHSAGGWLARAAMGDGIWSECEDEDLSLEDLSESNKSKVIIRTSDRIRCLATIGSIHQAPEQDTTTCVTRGALKYTNDHYPGAFLKNEGIGYVSIGGISSTTTTSSTSSVEENKNDQRVAYTSYKAVSGNEKYTLGDGVVPIEWTQLLGSKQIQLNNVLHSKHNYRAANIPVSATTTAATAVTVTTSATQRQQQQQQQSWYGSENVIDQWLSFVLEEANLVQRVVKVKNVSNTKRQQVATTSTFFDNLLVKTRVAAVAVLGEKQIVQVEQEQQAVVTTFDKSVIVDDNRKSSLSSLSSQQQQQYRRQQQRRQQQRRQRRTIKYRHVRSFNVLLRRRMLQVFLLFLKIMNIPQQKPSSLFNFNKNSKSNDKKR